MRRFTCLIACLLLSSFAFAQDPVLIEPQSVGGGLTAKVVAEKSLWTAEGYESIEANGKTYLAFTAPPKPVAAVMLELTNNGQPYIEISKVGSAEFPVVVDEYKPGLFIFEHSGAGVYHIRSTDSKGRPAYAKFTVGVQPPPDNPPPVEPPPTTGHTDLVKILTKRPADSVTSNALSAGYLKAISASQADTVTLDQSRKIVSESRAEALRSVPPLAADWNVILIEAGSYLMKLANKADYLAAIKVMADELANPKATAVQPQNNLRPTQEILYSPRVPVFFYPQNCPTCVPVRLR